MVLDLGLPDGDGLELLAALRGTGDDCAVLILTAREALPDRIGGLNAGADDYLVKPFDLGELVARLHAMIRRRAGRARPQQIIGSLVIDPLSRQVTSQGRAVELSPREFDVLQALARRPGAVLSRQALEEAIYGWDEEPASNAVEVHVHHLRRKLGADLITNIRGVGYRLAD
jgi:two-component system response regulator QseB